MRARNTSPAAPNLSIGKRLNRRRFLKISGALAAMFGIGGLSELNTRRAEASVEPIIRQQVSAADMMAAEQKSLQTFVANIGKDPGFWGVPAKYTLDGDTKVFTLTCTQGKWEVSPGNTVDAMMYNGRVPGEVIRVTEGDKVRVIVNNRMNEATVIHWHGVHTPNNMDGVPFITQSPIRPGESFTYEFVAKPAGSHMYHAHENSMTQVTSGLMGAFIVDPIDKSNEPQVTADYVLVLNDTGIGFSLNAKGYPLTQPIVAKVGDRIRIRYMNEGLMIHPMHLHGMYQKVIAKDGVPLATPYLADTITIAPGERWDVLVECETPGIWAFHCHILSHAEGPNGMFGMVTAVVIK